MTAPAPGLPEDRARAWIMHLWLKGWALAPEAERALGRPAFVRRTADKPAVDTGSLDEAQLTQLRRAGFEPIPGVRPCLVAGGVTYVRRRGVRR